MKTLYTLSGYIATGIGLILGVQLYAAPPVNPPTTSSAPNGGYFAQYFSNMVGGCNIANREFLTGFDNTNTVNYGRKTCTPLATFLAAFAPQAGKVLAGFDGNGDPVYVEDSLWKKNGTSIYYNSGSVGIGTGSPSAKLDISSRIRLDYDSPIYGIGITAAGPGLGGWARRYGFTNQVGDTRLGGFGAFGIDNNLSYMWIGKDYNDTLVNFFPSTYTTVFSGSVQVNGTNDEIARFQTSGNPFLSLYKNAGRQAYLISSGSLGLMNQINSALFLGTNNTWQMTILANGNIGIGTTAPSNKLDVDGQIRIRGGTPGVGKALTSSADGTASWGVVPSTFNLANSIWLTSVPDGVNRFYFGNGDRTYFGSANGYEWRNNISANIGVLDNNGNFSLGTSGTDGRLTVRGGKVSIGDSTTEDFLPVGSNWDYTLQLNGVDNTSIGFHDGGVSVSSIRYNNAGFTIGGDDGWGTKNVGIGRTPSGYRLHVAGDIYADGGWLRSSGNTGWYNETYGGGLYMSDGTWIRTYNGKNFYHDNGIMRTDGTFQVGGGGGTLSVVNGGNFAYESNILYANTAGNVGIGTSNPSTRLHVNGNARITGTLQIQGGSPGNGKVLTSDASGNATWGSAPITSETDPKVGTLTTNYLSKWSGASLTNSLLFDNGTNIGIGTSSPGVKLHISSTVPEVARFHSTTANPFISLWGGAERKGYLSSSGGNLTLMNEKNASLFLGSNNIRALTLGSDGRIGIGTDTPTTDLDIEGQIRIRGGLPGDGKVLTSNADGTASWKSLPAAGGGGGGGGAIPDGYTERYANVGEDVYGGWGADAGDTCGNGNAAYTCSNNDNRTCTDREGYPDIACTSQGDSGDICSPITSYRARSIQCIGTQILVKDNNYCRIPYPSCGSDGRCTLTLNASAGNEAWVKGDTSCGFTCINGYSGANCEIPPCEEINIRWYPGCDIPNVYFGPTNAKNNQFYAASREYSGGNAKMYFCESAVSSAAKDLWVNPRIYSRQSIRPIPGGLYGFWSVEVYNGGPGNYYLPTYACPPDPCAGGGCGGG